METYRPEAVVMQCGADSLTGDRLGCFNLTVKGGVLSPATAVPCPLRPLTPALALALPLAPSRGRPRPLRRVHEVL